MADAEIMKDELLTTFYQNGKMVSRRLSPKWLSGRQDLQDRITTATSFLPADRSLRERVWCIVNDINAATCKNCPNTPAAFFEQNRYYDYCSRQCFHQATNHLKPAAFAKKDHAAANAKRMATTKANTGYEFNSQRPDVKAKISKERSETQLQHLTDWQKDKLADIEWLKFQYVDCLRTSVHIAAELGVDYSTVLTRLVSVGTVIRQHTFISMAEYEVGEYIKSLGFDIVRSDRAILEGQESDIHVPAKNLSIEYNGYPWHCEKIGGKSPKYHLRKTELSLSKGIDLFHIFADEWEYRKPQVKSMLRSKLGLYDLKIGARQTKVVECTTKQARTFFDENHIDGFESASLYLGLQLKDQIVSMASFRLTRFKRKVNDVTPMEIIRFASSQGVQVISGLSKLLKEYQRRYDLPLISYCDRARSEGKAYLAAGMQFIENTDPDFWWVKGDYGVVGRQFAFHDKLEKMGLSVEGLSQANTMLHHGYDRCFGCGNAVYVLHSTKDPN